MLSERELASRVDIDWERYVKVQNIEANCARRHRLDDDPAGHGQVPRPAQRRIVVAGHQRGVRADLRPGRHARRGDRQRSSTPSTRPTRPAPLQAEARVFCDEVIPAQSVLREVADELETLVDDELWPLPKYRELLFQY